MTVITGVGHPTIYLDFLRDIVVFLQGKQKTLSSQTRQNYPVWYIDKNLDFYGTKRILEIVSSLYAQGLQM